MRSQQKLPHNTDIFKQLNFLPIILPKFPLKKQQESLMFINSTPRYQQ